MRARIESLESCFKQLLCMIEPPLEIQVSSLWSLFNDRQNVAEPAVTAIFLLEGVDILDEA